MNLINARIKQTIKNIALGLSVAIFFFLCVEISLRTLLPFPISPRPTYEVSDTMDFFHKRNSVSYETSPFREFKPVKLEYNKYGFRGTHEKIAESMEFIYILGDSYIEARQVPFEDTISEILNSKLMIQDKFIINAGCSNYGILNQYWLLKYHILNLQPKPSRILSFFCFNDYTDDFKYYYGKDNFDMNKIPEKSAHLRTGNTIDEWLQLNIATYAYLRHLYEPFKLRKTIQVSIVAGHPRLVNIADEDLAPQEKYLFLQTHKALLEISNLCNRNKIRMTVFIIPYPPQVDRDEWKFGKVIWGGGYQEHESDQATFYQDRLLTFCRSNKIECVDLLGIFKSETKKGKIYFDYDGHFTPHGQKVIAQLISDHLKDEK